MSLYEFLVIVHILAAAVWIGGGIMITAIAARAWSSREDSRVIELSRIGDFVGNRVFAPATLLVIISGAWAVTEGPWKFDQAWISIGFAGWIVGLLLALLWHRVEGSRIRAAVADGGAAGAAARRIANLSLGIGLLELAILVVVVWAMVAKPGL
jgi:uncharacterized membrane protein